MGFGLQKAIAQVSRKLPKKKVPAADSLPAT